MAGTIVAPDPEMAQRWFRAAAEPGHPRAQLMLGRYLVRGTAGSSDHAEARLWFERAEGQGVTEATLELTRLRNELTGEAQHSQGNASAA